MTRMFNCPQQIFLSNILITIQVSHGRSCDHTDCNVLSQLADKHDPTSILETVNALYIPTKVKSLDSLLKRIDDRSGIGVTITPNPSYNRYHVGPNSLQSGKELEYD